ncbi:MAG: serine hydrolase domain-containing protein, partial [Candidatus Dormibacteria bacterium]
HIPRRIFPPGEIVAYSNYGASLAGYIVQRVSGQKYADYIAENIFQPLGMSHSTMLQPLPARLAPLMSAGYKAASGPPVPFEFIEVAPAGALSSTSADMAKFMIAQLQNGRLGARQILKPATARLMHTPQHTEALGFNGFDLGFYDENRNGRRIIGHAGDTEVFHSDLHLILDANVGLFMSFNSTGANGAVVRIRTALFAAFLDRYFPYTAPSQPTVSTAVADSKRVVGWYMSSRRIESALDLINPLSEGEVTAKPDGTIAFAPLKGLAGSPKRWREVGPLVYREIGGPTHLVFVTDARGRIKYLTTDDFVPVLIFQRVPVWQQENFVLFLIGGSLVIFLVTVIVWPLGWLVRRHYHQPLDLPPVASRLRLIARLACIVSLLVAAGWLAFLTGLTIAGSVSDAWLYILYIAGVLALVGTIGAVANCAVTWAGPQRGRWWPKIAETLIALAGLA